MEFYISCIFQLYCHYCNHRLHRVEPLLAIIDVRSVARANALLRMHTRTHNPVRMPVSCSQGIIHDNRMIRIKNTSFVK